MRGRGTMRAAAALVLLLGATAAEAWVVRMPKPVVVVRNDHGGMVEERLRIIARYLESGTRVEIRGSCASACTMFLGLPSACVHPSAKLGFHGPQSQYYGISLPPDEFERWSGIMAEHYPEPIRRWFMDVARHTTMELITISGSEAISMGARPCA